jgi:hypothetical protein
VRTQIMHGIVLLFSQGYLWNVDIRDCVNTFSINRRVPRIYAESAKYMEH